MKLLNLLTGGCLLLAAHASGQNTGPDFEVIRNKGGKDIGYSKNSGVKLLTVNDLSFKDLNRNGKLDKYEDWRLTYEERAADLATRLTVEQIAGLMLYSSHQSIPARADGYFAGTYNGKPYKEGETDPRELTDQQKKFLKEDNLRHVLVTSVKSPEVAAGWNNRMQAYCEGVGLGIPANNSSDPRHSTIATAEYNAAAGGAISMWPSSLGMAATFDPELVRKFGTVAAAEYRALGITTALSPQVDIATEPRWGRFNGTFGESPVLAAAMAEAYCDGFQSESWGAKSVNAMVKHWPGGGAGEAGRDGHYGNGQFAVYPGNNFNTHLIPFINGAFKLKRGTKTASAVMPYYTISWNQTPENVANNYNKYIVNDLLREKYGYTGVICTDWGVTGDRKVLDSFLDGKSFGVEHLSMAERHYKILMAGADQFGGNNDALPILEAYQIGIKEHGEKWMRNRMEESAQRLLLNIFRVGLFENPYLDPSETQKVVGKPEFMKAGYEAQLKSVVLLKNQQNVLPVTAKKTVYIPKRFIPASRNFLGMETPASLEYPLNISIVKKYFDVTDDPAKADLAIVYIENPKASTGYDKADLENKGNGYIPISLQYGDYTATDAREVSIAGGDPLENFTNRSYKGKTVKTPNITDAQLVKSTREAMKDKPLVLLVNTTNPLVFSEIEPYASSVLLSFGVQDQALIETIAGKSEPGALLPMQMPANMSTVEKQAEDVPFDLECYKDAAGNVYDFGFGMNWKGVIRDKRKSMYK
ncbi:glycoside hydrolase family 3 protein [Leadbetterella sp. DM7]|uniref:glycoside hydrolase family 3 protein n=1 Tax=Leadbetterella sp. DM7 TaxID=3235085 RepID=UPI00349EC6D5